MLYNVCSTILLIIYFYYCFKFGKTFVKKVIKIINHIKGGVSNVQKKY